MQCPFEKKTAFNAPSITSPQLLAQQVKSKLELHPVEIINNEVICAGQTIQGAAACLIHFRVLPGGTLEATIKSTAAEIGDYLINQLLPQAFGSNSGASSGLSQGLLF
jgi:hypothetical protein